MEKYDANVESINVIGQQIDSLADRRLAQRGSGHFQSFTIDKRATGHANLHAHVQDTHHIGMNDEHVNSRTQNDASGAPVCVELINFHSVKISQHLAQ